MKYVERELISGRISGKYIFTSTKERGLPNERAREFAKAPLWRVLEMSIQDMDDARKMPKIYKIDMGTWHEPNSHCSICQAGAVLARTFKLSPKTLNVGEHALLEVQARLSALNVLRGGSIGSAFRDCLSKSTEAADKRRARRAMKLIKEGRLPQRISVAFYSGDDGTSNSDYERYKTDLLEVVAELKKHNV